MQATKESTKEEGSNFHSSLAFPHMGKNKHILLWLTFIYAANRRNQINQSFPAVHKCQLSHTTIRLSLTTEMNTFVFLLTLLAARRETHTVLHMGM